MSEAMELALPWPPSVNTYWRHIPKKGGVRSLISRRGREYRGQVASDVLEAVAEERPDVMRRAQNGARLAVAIEAYPPTRGRHDIDNITKAVLDALEHAGVYSDDSQIDDLRIRRRDVRRGGWVVVHIEEAA